MSALISNCQQYRYWLQRPSEVDQPAKPAAVFVMLNPSSADTEVDDPTIRRCRQFAKIWRCAGLMVANLYALRSAKPGLLWQHDDPVGPDNDYWLATLATRHSDIICAWGNSAEQSRVEKFQQITQLAEARLWCLGTTKTGAPRHPLYVRFNQPLIKWSR